MRAPETLIPPKSLRETVRLRLVGATTLSETRDRLILVLGEHQGRAVDSPLGYVAGIIASDGHAHIARNAQALGHYTDQVQGAGIPVFSAVDVFGETGLWDVFVPMISRGELSEQDFLEFWRAVLQSGHITDVFMTPRWEQSRGASDEHKIARELQTIRVHYVQASDAFIRLG